jgi:hypothetical protein
MQTPSGPPGQPHFSCGGGPAVALAPKAQTRLTRQYAANNRQTVRGWARCLIAIDLLLRWVLVWIVDCRNLVDLKQFLG